MSHPVHLDFEVLSLRETARRLGVSPSRAKAIVHTFGDGDVHTASEKAARKPASGRKTRAKNTHARKAR
jgi:hypothetical protein